MGELVPPVTAGDNRSRGLYNKYRVERSDGQLVGPCVVLEIEDPNAWPSLLLWADTVEADGYKDLAIDVRTWVHNTRQLRSEQRSKWPLPSCPDPDVCVDRGPCPYCDVLLSDRAEDGEVRQ